MPCFEPLSGGLHESKALRVIQEGKIIEQRLRAKPFPKCLTKNLAGALLLVGALHTEVVDSLVGCKASKEILDRWS